MAKNKYRKTSNNRLFCLNCGNEGLNIFRNYGHQYKSFHRKKMYCIYCKRELNFIEIKTDEDYQAFKEEFDKGTFIEEAKESMRVCH